MPRVCTVCTHTARAEIDKALVSGEPNRRIAAQYSLSESSIRRHKDDHLPVVMVKAQDAAEVVRGGNLLNEMQKLQEVTWGLLGQATTAGDNRTALMAVREARGNVELIGRLLGELQDQAPTVNVLVASSEWAAVRTRLVTALAPYPDARDAVLAVLEAADAG